MNTQRHLFDIPEDIAYFNCATNSPLLNESVKRLQEGVISKSQPWRRKPADFFEDAETIRHLSAALFGGDADGYAVIPAASYGISTAARVLEPTLKKGDQILVMEEEFPSVILPFRRVAQETGAQITTVATPVDGDWTRAICESINKKVKVVAISSCHWTNGAFIDLLQIRKQCDEVNAALIIDATQTLGAVPCDMDAIQPDFMVAAGYKWLLCPYGFSLMYVNDKWRNSRPLEECWLAREKADDFANLVNYQDTYMPGARRYEMGEKCIPTILPGAIAALEQLEAWGVQNIAETLSVVNQKITSQLSAWGFGIAAESLRLPHMFGAKIPGYISGDLVSDLTSHNIYVSKRGQSIRFAPHLHINDNDIDKLLSTINAFVPK